MDGMNRDLDGAEFYVNGVDTLCDVLKQELGEKLYDYPGTWFSESTIKEFYGQKDEIWAIQLSNILGDILKNEPDLSEKLKTGIESEIMLLESYIDDIQRERGEYIPTPDDAYYTTEGDHTELSDILAAEAEHGKMENEPHIPMKDTESKPKRSILEKLREFKEKAVADKKDIPQHEHKRDDNVR